MCTYLDSGFGELKWTGDPTLGQTGCGTRHKVGLQRVWVWQTALDVSLHAEDDGVDEGDAHQR